MENRRTIGKEGEVSNRLRLCCTTVYTRSANVWPTSQWPHVHKCKCINTHAISFCAALRFSPPSLSLAPVAHWTPHSTYTENIGTKYQQYVVHFKWEDWDKKIEWGFDVYVLGVILLFFFVFFPRFSLLSILYHSCSCLLSAPFSGVQKLCRFSPVAVARCDNANYIR